MFRPPSIIESDRLLLRPPVESDSDEIFRCMLGDADVTRWLSFPRHRSAAESLAAVRRYRENWRTGAGYAWVGEIKDGGGLAGLVELQPYMPRVEIGVISCNQARNRRRTAGLHVLRRLIDWLIAHPDVHRVHAFCAPEGRAAGLMERMGFQLEARLANWEIRPNSGSGETPGDSLLFALTRPRPGA